MMHWLCTAFIFVIVACFGIKTIHADHGSHNLRIVLKDDVLEDYQRFLSGRDPLQIDSFDGPYSRRDVVEVVLIQQALQRGGWLGHVTFVPVSSSSLMLELLADGEADLTGSSVWLRDVEQQEGRVSNSIVVVPEGRFEAGFYMMADNPDRLKIKNLRAIRLLRGVSSRDWVPDWQALGRLRLADLVDVPVWELMVKLVAEGKADFLLAPFQSGEELELAVNGVRMLPIPDYKIVLHGSRHFAVNGIEHYSKDLLIAVDQGLRELEQIGRIKQAYRQSGFFNPKVVDWITIGSDEIGQSDLMRQGFTDKSNISVFSLSDVTRRLYPETTVF